MVLKENLTDTLSLQRKEKKMSLKIYNGYIFDKEYSLQDLSLRMKHLRLIVNKEVKRQIYQIVINEFSYYYNYSNLHDIAHIQKKMENFSKLDKEILRCLIEKNWSLMYMYIMLRTEEKVSDISALQSVTPVPLYDKYDYDFRCSLHIYPLRKKLIALYVGRDSLQNIISIQPYLSDYHYQNQTDKPEKISDEEWEIRKQDWEEAIGPDYIVNNHGFSANLSNYANIYFSSKNEVFADIEPDHNKIKADLRDSFSDFPKCNDGVTISEYVDSPEYKKWKKEKTGIIQKAYVPLSRKEIIEMI